MAEEVLVKEPLTQDMIEAGQEMAQILTATGYEYDALFWLYTSEANMWRLTIVSSKVKDGPLKAYAELREALESVPNGLVQKRNLGLFGISLMNADDPLVLALAGASKMTNLSDQRLTRTYINWVYIEDAYVYFISNSLEGMPVVWRDEDVDKAKPIKFRRMRSSDISHEP